MIADLKPYSEYRESKLPWAGSIPSHWNIKRGKALFKESQLAVRDGDEIVTCFRDGQVTLRRNRRMSGFMMALYEAGYQGVRKGQLVIHAMDAFAGAVGVSESDGKCTPEYIVADPRTDAALASYFALLLRFAAHQGFILVSCPAVRERAPRFRYPDFGDMQMPLPPAVEQVAIVRFLDWAKGRLERAIRAKRKVIALLNEQKQSIIHRAVTRGLDPTVLLKPSGIPWLGDIPQHWEVRKLKYLTGFVNGLAFKPGDWKAEGIPIIRIQNLNGSDVYNYTNRTDLPKALLIRSGDLMFAWSGNRGTSFGSFEWDRDVAGYLNQHIFKLVGYTLPRRYFYYVLRAVTRYVEEQAGGIIGLVHVTKPELGSVQVPLAPLAEAEAIALNVDSETSGINRAISRLNREIELLREYQTRLVADVVTGKLDVRAAAAKLPEEADDLESLDDADAIVEGGEDPDDKALDTVSEEAEA